jgi:hypothetical protein
LEQLRGAMKGLFEDEERNGKFVERVREVKGMGGFEWEWEGVVVTAKKE